MKVSVSFKDLREERAKLEEPVGIVPTMGYLHEGHMSLVRQAKVECASVVVTIYVNPTQFAPNEDLSSYPRNIPGDLEKLQKEGVDLVWLPTDEAMYPEGYQTYVDVRDVTKPLEGAKRPTHFQGVTTVVSKLYNAISPQKAFFGQKDAQQVAVVTRMALDLGLSTQVIPSPIVREADGLALSSRNVRLSTEERAAAPILRRALDAAGSAYDEGEREADVLRALMEEVLAIEPLAQVEYVSVADPLTLREVQRIEGPALLSMAVLFGTTRLIDNELVGMKE